MSTAALRRAKVLSAAENRTIGMIANGVHLPEVLDELCRTIDALSPGVVSTVLLMDADGKRLWPGAGPRFPAALKPAINPWMVGPGRGACGTAAFLKDLVIIADVTTDPRWPDEYRALAVSHGLRASWSQPLITGAGAVLGTFAMYYAESRVPEAADLELIEAAGQIALIAIQLERSQAALRESEGRFRLVVNTIPVMIWTSDADSRWTYLNSVGAAEVYQEIAAASGQVADLIQDVHALSHRLHSAKLDLLGLTRAAGGLCAEIADLHGVAIDFQAENVADGLPQDVSLCLFRVLQEALQNATKHSGSRQIHVSLRSGARAIELAVVDGGVGFDQRVVRERGLGLTSMTERLKLVDGELLIDSKPGEGTSVRARIPLDRARSRSVDRTFVS
jgi:GAF domain-containing protein